MHSTSHLLYDHLADTEAEAPSSWVSLSVLIQIIEVNKQALKLIFWYSAAEVLDTNFKLYVASLVCLLL